MRLLCETTIVSSARKWSCVERARRRLEWTRRCRDLMLPRSSPEELKASNEYVSVGERKCTGVGEGDRLYTARD